MVKEEDKENKERKNRRVQLDGRRNVDMASTENQVFKKGFSFIL